MGEKLLGLLGILPQIFHKKKATTNFTNYVLQVKKRQFKIQLWSDWNLPVIFIVTSVYKLHIIKLIVFYWLEAFLKNKIRWKPSPDARLA